LVANPPPETRIQPFIGRPVDAVLSTELFADSMGEIIVIGHLSVRGWCVLDLEFELQLTHVDEHEEQSRPTSATSPQMSLLTTPEQIARLPNVGLAEGRARRATCWLRRRRGLPNDLGEGRDPAGALGAQPSASGWQQAHRTGLFLEANGLSLRGSDPNVDVPMVERIAAGQVEQQQILGWQQAPGRLTQQQAVQAYVPRQITTHDARRTTLRLSGKVLFLPLTSRCRRKSSPCGSARLRWFHAPWRLLYFRIALASRLVGPYARV
jgi:hypothetical protein